MRSLLALLIWSAALLLAPSAQALRFDYTVTAVVTIFGTPGGPVPDDPPPLESGDVATLTFTVDDQTSQSDSTGPDQAEYDGAISNLELSVDNGRFLDADGSLARTVLSPGNHRFFGIILSDDPGFSTNLPLSFPATPPGELSEDFEFFSMVLSMTDPSESSYTQMPPELVAPDPALFTGRSLEISWQSAENPASFIFAQFQVAFVQRVPEPTAAVAAAALWLGLAGCRRRR